MLNELIAKLKKASGGDLYTINIGKNSPKVIWDYKIKNIMNKSFYLPGEKIGWTHPNDLQLKIQKLYSYVFRIVPYDSFTSKLE